MDTYLQKCFASGNVQLFIGSGLSTGLYPDSNELRDRFMDDAIYAEGHQTTLRSVLGSPAEVSLEDAAEFYELYQGADALVRVIKSVYGTIKRPENIHEDLWKLPHVRWVYTTNFDCLIEDALGRPKQRPEVITRGIEIADLPRNQRVVFKPHGCARRSASRQEFVVTRNDYLNYSHRHTLEMLKTLYDVSTRVFLFLGYSLRDLNMRHIITEAGRIGSARCYAVLRDTSGPEARYWQKLGVTLIRQDANEFVTEVFKSFPAYEFEWDEKMDARVEEKEEISNKCLLALKEAIEKCQSLTVIIDAGSSTLAFAKTLAREVLGGNDMLLSKVRIVTNSPLIMDELTPAVRLSKGEPSPTMIGGPLRFSTRAYTPDETSAQSQLRPFVESGIPILAFMGATAVDESGLKTKTEAEVAIKKAFIGVAREVYILADHSKIRNITGHVFSLWDKERMTIVTDRSKEMQQLRPMCKAIR